MLAVYSLHAHGIISWEIKLWALSLFLPLFLKLGMNKTMLFLFKIGNNPSLRLPTQPSWAGGGLTEMWYLKTLVPLECKRYLWNKKTDIFGKVEILSCALQNTLGTSNRIFNHGPRFLGTLDKLWLCCPSFFNRENSDKPRMNDYLFGTWNEQYKN